MKVLTRHDARWKALFAAEAQSLRKCLGSTAVQIHHIGGTAIPGILTKPVIDIALEVTSLEALDRLAASLEDAGYEARGEYGIPGRRYFKKKPDECGAGFHLHSFAYGSEYVVRHVRFRDFLLQEPAVAQEYSALKQSLASPEGVLVANYAERKSGFVRRILHLAELRFAGRAE